MALGDATLFGGLADGGDIAFEIERGDAEWRQQRIEADQHASIALIPCGEHRREKSLRFGKGSARQAMQCNVADFN